MIKIVSTKGIAEIILLFCIVMGIGFSMAYGAIVTSKVSIINSSLLSPQFTDFAYIIDIAIFGTLLMIALRRHHSKTIFFRILEFIVVGFTSFFVFLVFYNLIMPANIGGVVALPGKIGYALSLPVTSGADAVYALSIVSAVLLMVFKEMHPGAKDLATMMSSIGVGMLLGISFPFMYAMTILAIVAVYDYISIFMTKVIVSFDKALISMNIAFLISVADIEAIPHGYFGKKEEDSYEEYLIRSHEAESPEFSKIIREGKLPVVSQVSLGEGDLSLPLMAAISAYYTYANYAFAGIIILGGVLGVVLTMLLLKMYKKPLPAIPPLFAFISIAGGIGYLATGVGIGQVSLAFVAFAAIILYLTFRALLSETYAGKKAEKRAWLLLRGRKA